jgi:signal transduction histidine kinase
MRLPAKASNFRLYPLRVFLVIITTVFVTEAAVMLLLPVLLPAEEPAWLTALLDACLLTVVAAPVFGWVIVRPLRRAAAIRTRLLEQFLAVQEEERRRFACDLHDEIGQSLTSVLIGLRTAADAPDAGAARECLEELRETVNSALHEVRRLARGLRPVALDYLGLGPALERYGEDFAHAAGVAVTVDAAGLAGVRLPADVATGVYRIVQEALTNAAKHAAARNACVTVARGSSSLRVIVADDGRGFDRAGSARVAADGSGLGLTGMSERAALLNGTVTVESAPGRGTRVTLSLPLAEEDHVQAARAAGG